MSILATVAIIALSLFFVMAFVLITSTIFDYFQTQKTRMERFKNDAYPEEDNLLQ